MRKAMTLEDYRASRQISDPPRPLDCSLVSGGGGAPQGRGRGVAIRAIGMKTTHNPVALMPDIPGLGMPTAGAMILKNP